MPLRDAAAYSHLSAADPVLAQLIEWVGRPDPFTWAEREYPSSTNFEVMALHIVGQQISTAAAMTIYRRLSDAAGGAVSPEGLLALPWAKAGYVHDLARRQAEGVIDLEGMVGVDDAAALAALTAVRGVGLWSAQMFLVHQLKRADVLPAGDIGIRRAVQRAWQLDAVPGVEETRRRALPWSPYRTYAAALLWASLAAPPPPAQRTAGAVRPGVREEAR
ncbi:hypothetical protein ABT124_43270 [Streptomyces sp. NPDC001982]|uniref:DNA-3-methyladenine glycosylase family protein n=1 Tax=Streptomyces sp. NPDC001982 TaxID=3154405 RepID=UPI00332E5205